MTNFSINLLMIPSYYRASLNTGETKILSILYTRINMLTLSNNNLPIIRSYVNEANSQLRNIGSTMVLTVISRNDKCMFDNLSCWTLDMGIALLCHCKQISSTLQSNNGFPMFVSN